MNFYQTKMIRLMQEISAERSMYETFFDFTKMAACSISNTFDKIHLEERKKIFLDIRKKYTKQEQENFDHFFDFLVAALEEEPGDVLGELYMILEISNKNTGQFFTPYDTARLLAEITFEERKKELIDGKSITFHDPCIGGGVTLIALANAMSARGYNYQRKLKALCGDVDANVLSMAYVQCSLLGIDAIFEQKNALTNESAIDVWFTPFYAMNRAREKQTKRELERARKVIEFLKKEPRAETGQLSLF